MSTWLERATSSHKLQLTATALISGVLAASAVISYQKARHDYKINEIKSAIPSFSSSDDADDSSEANPTPLTPYGAAVADLQKPSREDERSAALALRARQGDYDEALILEQLARNRVFLTDDGLRKLRDAVVVVVGLGGVGSHCAAALARSGCGRLRLIDFDQVTLSSLNRHAVATLADVGTPKVRAMQRRLEQVVPWTRFDCRNELFGETVAERQLEAWGLDGDDEGKGREVDYVVDAIDNIESKVALLAYCHGKGIKVVSSMGAGCKSDPTRIFLGDVSASTDDPLSKSTRRRLRMKGVASGIPVAYSTEKPGPGKAQLLPLPENEFERGKVGELGVLPDFRVRILPVLGTMPAMFGLVVANHVILEITGYPHEYLVAKGREKMYDGILGNVQGMEERLARFIGEMDPVGIRIPITVNDVGYLVEEVYRGRSVVSGLSTRLTLTRWRQPWKRFVVEEYEGQKQSLLKMCDLVCMTKEEAAKHEKEVLKGPKSPEELYDREVVRLVEARMEEEKALEKYR